MSEQQSKTTMTTIGDRVKLKDSNLVGVVRFIGELTGRKGIYYGIELDVKKGSNDGSIGKTHYFKTSANRGLFVKSEQILKHVHNHKTSSPQLPRVTVGDTVYVKKFQCNGVVRYIGEPDFHTKSSSSSSSSSSKGFPLQPFQSERVWYGVELEHAKGKNNGSVDGSCYFQCKTRHGTFVRALQLKTKPLDVDVHDDDEKTAALSSTPTPTQSTWTKQPGRSRHQRHFKRQRSKSDVGLKKKSRNGSKLSIDVEVEHSNAKQQHRKLNTLEPRSRSKTRDVTAKKPAAGATVGKTTPVRSRSSTARDRDRDKTHAKAHQLTSERQKTSDRSLISTRTESLRSNQSSQTASTPSVNTSEDPGMTLNMDAANKRNPHNTGAASGIAKPRSKSTALTAMRQKLSERSERSMVSEFESLQSTATATPLSVHSHELQLMPVMPEQSERSETSTIATTLLGNEPTVGDVVRLTQPNADGVVKFMGCVSGKPGVFYGIDLHVDESVGKNNGSFGGRSYFTTTAAKSGLFVKRERIAQILMMDSSPQKRVLFGDLVLVPKFGCQGRVQFIGITAFKKGLWYGIELEDAKGKNDGSVAGVRYFKCDANFGTFVQLSSIDVIIRAHTAEDGDGNTNNVAEFVGKKSSSNVNKNENETDSNLWHRLKSACLDVVQTENDLVGFVLSWLVGLVYILYLRATSDREVVHAGYTAIVMLVFGVCAFTWIFSYILTRFKSREDGHGNMGVADFYVPFLGKLVVAAVWFGRLMNDIRRRVHDNADYGSVCQFGIVFTWCDLMLAVLASETFVTIVLLDSARNIEHYRSSGLFVHIFLFVTRPILWAYNRLIVMFVAFHCFYYFVFGVTPITLGICEIEDVRNLENIGVKILLLPFNNIWYLFESATWTHLELSVNDDITQSAFLVIQQFIILTTIVDVSMDIYAVYIQCRHSCGLSKKNKKSEVMNVTQEQSTQVIALSNLKQ